MKEAIALASLVVGISCHAAEPPAAPTSPLSIMLKASRNVQDISSISFSASGETIHVKYDKEHGKGVETKGKEEGRFYFSNGKHRHEYKAWDVNTGKVGWEMVSAFDGKRYQFLDKKKGDLGLYNTPPPGGPVVGPNPLLEPLLFLFLDGSPITWASARSTALWEERAAHCKFLKTSSENGSEMVVLEWTLPAGVARASFAKELDWYPIEFTSLSKDEIERTTIKVTRFHKAPVGSDFVVIPLVVETEKRSRGATMTSRREILLDTLKVNELIDDAIFTIPVTEAKNIYDPDKERMQGVGLGSMKPPLPILPQGEAARSPIVLYVVLNVAALFAVGGLLWWVIRRRRIATVRSEK